MGTLHSAFKHNCVAVSTIPQPIKTEAVLSTGHVFSREVPSKGPVCVDESEGVEGRVHDLSG